MTTVPFRAQCIFATLLLTGCGGSAAVTPGQAFQDVPGDNVAVHRVALANGASFTQFPLPRWQSAQSVALDRTSTPWVLTQFAIDRVGTDGHVTTFPMPAKARGLHGFLGLYGGIALGRDGALWFLGEVRYPSKLFPTNSTLFRLTTEGKLTSYPLPGPNEFTQELVPFDIASGVDGKLWFTIGSDNSAGPGCTLGSASTQGVLGPYAHACNSDGVATGPDGNDMWVAGGGQDPEAQQSIESYSAQAKAGRSFRLPLTSNPEGIATGPDGNLWITVVGFNEIMRLTITGKRTMYALPTKYAFGKQSWGPQEARIVSGSNAMWFVEPGANAIGRISMSGQITEYAIPTPHSGVTGLAISSSCSSYGVHLWFVESASNKLAMLTAPC